MNRIVEEIASTVDQLDPIVRKIEEKNDVALGLIDVHMVDKGEIVESQFLHSAFDKELQFLQIDRPIGLFDESLYIREQSHVRHLF